MISFIAKGFAVVAILLLVFFGSRLTVKAVEPLDTIFIRADGTVEPSWAPIVIIDDSTYALADNIHGSIVVQRNGVVVNGSGFSVQGDSIVYSVGVSLANVSGVSVVDFAVSGFDYGIRLNSTIGCSVSSNSVISNSAHSILRGISLFDSLDSKVFENAVEANVRYGILLSNCCNCAVSGNRMTQNRNYCLWCLNSVNSSISRNDIGPENGVGVFVDRSMNNLLFRNNIAGNAPGILVASSNGSVLWGNDIKGNEQYGIGLASVEDCSIYDNNIIDNAKQVTLYEAQNVTWNDDRAGEGNYWGSPNGDFSFDGICDDPFSIDKTNVDRFPLAGLFHCFDVSPTMSVNVISNSTVEGFEYSSSEGLIRLHVTNSSSSQTFGFCRVLLPNNLFNTGSLSVSIDGGQVPVLFANFTLLDNSTHRWIYFAYPHTNHTIVIVPEFPELALLLSSLWAIIIMCALWKKRF